MSTLSTARYLAIACVAFLAAPAATAYAQNLAPASYTQSAPQPVQNEKQVPSNVDYRWQGSTGESQAQHPFVVAQPGVSSNGVHYVTGGIGDEERDSIEAVKSEYNLHVLSSNRAGEFNGDTHVTIRSSKGEQILSIDAGPLLYVNLPAGTYTVEAASGQEDKTQKVTVGRSKSAAVDFRW